MDGKMKLPIAEKGYDIAAADAYISMLQEEYNKLYAWGSELEKRTDMPAGETASSEEIETLRTQNRSLYNNCVAFAKHIKRLEKLCVLLLKESRLLEYEDEIQEMVQKQMDDSQREYYLREQLKVISSQLNNGVSPEEEIQEFRDKIAALPVDDASKEKLLRECDRLERYAVQSPEAA